MPVKRHVILVPGILGSSLRFVGEGPLKNRVDEPVWDQDIETIWDTLARQPERLTGDLVPAGVLRQLRFFKVTYDLYGPLLDHLKSVGFSQSNGRLTEFAYDWRQDNRR